MPPSEADKSSYTIFDSIRQAKVEDLEVCIKRGSTINEIEKTRDKFTPLHCAAYHGSLECLHWLLWQEADPSITTPKGWTPTHVAAIRGQYSCIQALIKNGININARDYRGQTPAHLAATHGHSHTLQAILRSGADINIQDSNGWTPVHSASYHGRLGCLQFLKTAGGKLDECDNDGNTPAHLAAMEGNLPCLKYLLSNATNANSLIAARNDQGDTPKTLAQQFFKDQVVEYLEAVEWDRDHPEQAENLAFPAHVAAFNGDLDHIKLLVEQGVININERDDKGSTIAHKAAGQGHIHILSWLIENGADLKLTCNSGETARDVAKRFAQMACVKLLESEAASDEEVGYEKEDLNSHTESKDSIQLSAQQKKEAKSRAKKRLEDMEKQIAIARSNYLQLGGRLEDTLNKEFKNEQIQLKEQARTISELQNELEYERIRREKLEVQLDHTRQELERSIKSLRDYETKVVVLERYIQHTEKAEIKSNKKKNGAAATTKSKSPRRSSSKNAPLSRENTKTGFSIRKNSKSSTHSDLNSKQANNSFKPSHLQNLTNAQINELRRAFEEIDKDRSGFISRKEIKQSFRDLDIRASEDEIEVVINQMDTDRDGNISFEEFSRVMARNYYKKHSKDLIKEAFRKFDLNNSGYISAEEIRVVLSKMHRFYSRDEIEDLIRKCERDGVISIDNFIELID